MAAPVATSVRSQSPDETLRAWLAYELPATAARCRETAANLGVTIERELDLGQPEALADLEGCSLLVLEERDGATVGPRVLSLAGAHPDLLIVVLVPAPRGVVDAALLRAGAFDVIDDGPTLAEDFTHAVAAARRVLALQADRSNLFSDLAHQDKLSALGVMAAGVGHEINNPCSAILSNLTVMRDQLEATLARPSFERGAAFDRSVTEWLDAIGDCLNASDRIRTIVRTLSMFSRNTDARPVTTNVNEEIQSVMHLIGKEVRFNARFEVNLDRELPTVLAPPSTIAQTVTNLVINALQALEQAKSPDPTIWISTSHDDEHVMIEVRDNGPGIPAHIRDRVFDPFFTTKAPGKGTGLGLSITRQIVQRAGGDVFVESQPENGARFSVMLDRKDQAENATAAPLPPAIATERLRVLIVDDEQMVLRGLKRSLSSEFDCVCMNDPAEAIEMLRGDRDFDAILSDIIMPEMSGVEFYEELKKEMPDLAKRISFFTGGIAREWLREIVDETGCLVIDKMTPTKDLAAILREKAKLAKST